MNINELPKSRREARETNSVAYFTSKPCIHGHVEPRYTNTGICYECKRLRMKKWYIDNPELVKRINKKSYQKKMRRNPRAIRDIKKNYKIRHREKYLSDSREYEKNRRKNPIYRISKAISLGVWRSIKNKKAYESWQKFVDFSLEDLIIHLQSQFTGNMTLENYGVVWEIDHIKPVSKCQSVEEIWQLSNLQPLTITENRQKGNKWEER